MRKLRLSLLMAAALAVAVGCDRAGNESNVLKVDVTTGLASGVDVSSGLLSGSYAHANAPVREAGFEWGYSATELSEILQSPATTTPFSALLDGLGESKTYWYRAYVILQRGGNIQTFYGETLSFTTLKEEDSPLPPVPETPPDTPPVTPPDTPPGPDNPDIPQTPGSNVIGWYELPLMPLGKTGDYYYNTTDNTQYYAWHMCSGGEKGPGGKTARNYTVCYSGKYHCPLWVAAPRHSMYVGGSGRNDSYRRDGKIPADIQYNSKSTGGGCNKGHMLGSAERTSSVATNKDVFYYPNIAPQLSEGFNTGGGGWNLLEDWVDDQVCADTLYEVIGCYFDKYTDGYDITVEPKIISYGGRNDVSMPTMFYYILLRTKKGNSGKALKDCPASELKCAAFVRAHSNSLKGKKPSAKEMMSVADLEKITGVTYFPSVPNAPKNTYSASDWGL
jgi:DNA/RNA endonuclease G (NUC1)